MGKSRMNSQLLFPSGAILRAVGKGVPISEYYCISSIIHNYQQPTPVKPPPGFNAPTFVVDNGKYDTTDYHWISVLADCS